MKSLLEDYFDIADLIESQLLHVPLNMSKFYKTGPLSYRLKVGLKRGLKHHA